MKILVINLRNKFRRFLVKKSDQKIARLNVLIVQKGIKIISSNARTICRLQNHKEKEFVPRKRKKLKGSHIFINEDFCFEATQH